MSIETLTGDEFMQLTAEEHREAIGLYNAAIDSLATNLRGTQNDPPAREAQLDQLTRLATLRKVHKTTLSELEEAATKSAARLASERYRQNELAPAA